MKDHSCLSIDAASYKEIIRNFAFDMQAMEPGLAAARLEGIVCALGSQTTFIEIVARFSALKDCKTCKD